MAIPAHHPIEQPLTVVQVIPDLQPGGTVNHAIEIAEALTRGRHRAVIVSEGGRLESAAERAGATVIKLPVASKNPTQMVANARRLAELSRDLSADLLHAQSRAPAWSCLLASRTSKVPFIATYDGGFSERNPLKRFYNSVMVRGAHVIAPGERLAKMVEERYGTAREKISIVPNAIDLNALNPNNANRVRGIGNANIAFNNIPTTGRVPVDALVTAGRSPRDDAAVVVELQPVCPQPRRPCHMSLPAPSPIPPLPLHRAFPPPACPDPCRRYRFARAGAAAQPGI